MHPTLLPGEAKEHCDSVYSGDAESLWPKALEDARRGRLAPFFHRAFDRRTNMRSLERLGIYLVYNPLFRRETFKKHGMRLGTAP